RDLAPALSRRADERRDAVSDDRQSASSTSLLTVERAAPSAKRPTTSQVPGAPQLTSRSSLRPGATSTSRQPEPFHRSTWAPNVSDELPTATQLAAEAQSTEMRVRSGRSVEVHVPLRRTANR